MVLLKGEDHHQGVEVGQVGLPYPVLEVEVVDQNPEGVVAEVVQNLEEEAEGVAFPTKAVVVVEEAGPAPIGK